jgi:hypothetical protein
MDAAPRRIDILHYRKRNRNETKKHILSEDDKRMCLLIRKAHNKKIYIENNIGDQSTSQIYLHSHQTAH